jgi:hypothetical protein
MATEWDWLAAEYIQKTCPSFCHYQEAAAVKNGAFMEYIDKQHPSTHQPVLFRANISF